MFKNMLERSWLSTIRKPSRTIILIVILFVMANMMLATIAIKSAVQESITYAKESLGGTVYLQPDMDALRAQAASGMGSGSTGGSRVQIKRPDISIDTANDLATSSYVRDYTYSITGSANASSFTLVQTEESSMRSELESRMGSGETPPNMPSGSGFTFTRGDTNIIGINSFAFIADVQAGNMKLSSGAIFDESTEGSVIISTDLALENNLSVGDQLTLKTTSDETEITLKIIGTYDNTTDNYDPNTIYANIDTAAQFNSDDSLGVQSVKYYLTSAEDKDAFIAEAQAKYPTLEADGLTLDIDTSAYDQMVGPIESVGSFATTILWVVIIASVTIITLIVTINVKDRRYEMGVLMSLGATKRNVLGQIITELVIVATIAFALSIPTGTAVASAMGSGLLESQLSMEQEQTSQNFGRGQNAGRPSMGGANPQNTQVETINEINVNARPHDYIILFAAGYLIVIAAMIIPGVNILRYKPKTILSGKE